MVHIGILIHVNQSCVLALMLTYLNTLQAREVAKELEAMQIDYVITSPFQRCLQTSAGIVAELELPQDRWLVDWSFSEVQLLHDLHGCR